MATLNLAYFGVEFAVALAIGSVSLFADSVDFLEDNLPSISSSPLRSVEVPAISRARLGMALAGILLIPGVATLWTAWQKLLAPVPPAPLPLALAGLGALAVNLSCAFMLARFRSTRADLTRGRSISPPPRERMVLANVAIVVADLVCFPVEARYRLSGSGIATMNADAAREVWSAARNEHRLASG